MSLNTFSEIIVSTNCIVQILKNKGLAKVFLGSHVNYSKLFDVSIYTRKVCFKCFS